MDKPLMKLMAHPYVDADHGRVAFMRGPVLYCCEKKVENWEELDFTLGSDKPVMNSDGTVTVKSKDGEEFTLIEYRTWNNNGPLPMRIWFRQDGYVTDTMNTANALTDEPMIPWRTCMTAFFTSCNAVVVLDCSVGEEFL